MHGASEDVETQYPIYEIFWVLHSGRPAVGALIAGEEVNLDFAHLLKFHLQEVEMDEKHKVIHLPPEQFLLPQICGFPPSRIHIQTPDGL